MKVGVVVEQNDWQFFREIYEDWSQRYNTTLFQEREWRLPILYYRINRILLRHDLGSFLRAQGVAFFEWAGRLFVRATHLSKRCPLVTRLWAYELYEWAPKVNWDAVDCVVLPINAARQRFVQLYPSCTDKTVVINHGVDLNRFQPTSRQWAGHIGTVCHLTPRKRVYELVLTIYEMLQDGHHLHLHVVGGAPPNQQRHFHALRRLPEKLGISDHVTFYGHLSDPAPFYHKLDLFVGNSYHETQYVALLEAMASGCYCLSHFWDGAEEVLPEEYLFSTNRDLQAKIAAFAALSPQLKEEQQRRMRAIACEKFDIERTKVEMRQVIESTAGSRSIRR